MRRPVLMRLAILTLLIIAFTAPAIAGQVRIGIIDTRRVLQKSTPATDARGAFLMDVESKRNQLKEKEKEIRVLEKVLKSIDAKKSAAEKTRIQTQMKKEIKALRRLKSDMEEELKKEEARLTRRLLEEIRAVVRDYSKKKKFTVIFEKKLVVVSDEGIDITDDIIKLYNRKKRN